jgi:hypothetical protein
MGAVQCNTQLQRERKQGTRDGGPGGGAEEGALVGLDPVVPLAPLQEQSKPTTALSLGGQPVCSGSVTSVQHPTATLAKTRSAEWRTWRKPHRKRFHLSSPVTDRLPASPHRSHRPTASTLGSCLTDAIGFRGSTQTTKPKEGRWWWGSHAEMLRISPHQLGSSDAQRKQHPTTALHQHGTNWHCDESQRLREHTAWEGGGRGRVARTWRTRCLNRDQPTPRREPTTQRHQNISQQTPTTQSQSLTHSPRQDDGWGWALPDSAPRK